VVVDRGSAGIKAPIDQMFAHRHDAVFELIRRAVGYPGRSSLAFQSWTVSRELPVIGVDENPVSAPGAARHDMRLSSGSAARRRSARSGIQAGRQLTQRRSLSMT
jgi:hypothetical protein